MYKVFFISKKMRISTDAALPFFLFSFFSFSEGKIVGGLRSYPRFHIKRNKREPAADLKFVHNKMLTLNKRFA